MLSITRGSPYQNSYNRRPTRRPEPAAVTIIPAADMELAA